MSASLQDIITRLREDRAEAQDTVRDAQATVDALTTAINSLLKQSQSSSSKPDSVPVLRSKGIAVGPGKPSLHAASPAHRELLLKTKLRTALKDGPKTLRQLSVEMKESVYITKNALIDMRKTGEVESVGEKNGQKWVLPPAKGT